MADLLLRVVTLYLMMNLALGMAGIGQEMCGDKTCLQVKIEEATFTDAGLWLTVLTTAMGGSIYNVVRDAGIPNEISLLVFFPLVVILSVSVARAVRVLARA